MIPFFVEIVDKMTGEVRSRIGPLPSRQAELTRREQKRNIDKALFKVRVVNEKGQENDQPKM